LKVSGSTIYRTRRRFVEANLEGALTEEPRPGVERKLSSKESDSAKPSCANKRSPVSDRDAARSDLVQIAKRNGDFRKNYGVLVGAILYLRSINAARPRLFWWQALIATLAAALGFWRR
jgi:hypothetical protein